MEKISWPHHVRNKEVSPLHTIKERNILHTLKKEEG
jgi:hypothetical protein